MTKLTAIECKKLASLLRRAIDTNQLELVVRSPFASRAEQKAAGESVDERFDGNATNATGGLVLETETQSFAALERGDSDNDQCGVAIYIPQRALDFLNP